MSSWRSVTGFGNHDHVKVCVCVCVCECVCVCLWGQGGRRRRAAEEGGPKLGIQVRSLPQEQALL